MVKHATALFVAACLSAGCATVRTSQLRVTDAGTGQPIPGVQAERLGFMMQPAMPGIIPVSVPFPLETVMSDSSGIAQFRESGADFDLETEGYERTRISGTVRGFKVKDSLGSRYLALQTDGTLRVPLKKRQPD